MTPEMTMLALAGALSLTLALIVIGVHVKTFGGKMIRSNREAYPALTGLAGRAVRAHANLNEALLPFAIAVVCAAFTHVSTTVTVVAAEVFVAARVAHAGLYLAGIPEVRSLAFYIGLAATVVIFAHLPMTLW